MLMQPLPGMYSRDLNKKGWGWGWNKRGLEIYYDTIITDPRVRLVTKCLYKTMFILLKKYSAVGDDIFTVR